VASESAGELDHIAVRRSDNRLGHPGWIEPKVCHDLGDALSMQFLNHGFSHPHLARRLGGFVVSVHGRFSNMLSTPLRPYRQCTVDLPTIFCEDELSERCAGDWSPAAPTARDWGLLMAADAGRRRHAN